MRPGPGTRFEITILPPQKDDEDDGEYRYMEIKVLFFGVLAQVAETGFRHYGEIKSYSDLINRIRDEFPEISHYNYRIAVNSEIVTGEPELKDNDEVAFMPPFAGG